MTGSKKTENGNLTAKLELRRYFLRRYHSDGSANVMDCCQGSGVLWGRLREEFQLSGYWGVDVKPKKGRLKIDSARILAQPGWTQDVIDIDTYGSPWRHWLALLRTIDHSATVFLTVGQVQIAGSPLQNVVRERLQLGSLGIPNAIAATLNKIAVSWLLTTGCGNYKITIVEAVEAVSDGNARYIGLRVEPVKANGPELSPPSRSKRARTKKEFENV